MRPRVPLGQIAGDCATWRSRRWVPRRSAEESSYVPGPSTMLPHGTRCHQDDKACARSSCRPPSPLPARKAREVLFGKGQRGGKFRLPLPEELAHVGAILPRPAGLSPVTSRLPPPGRAASPSSQNRPAPLHTKPQPFPADSARSVSPGGPAPATPSAGADTGTCSLHYRQTCGCERRPPRSHAGQGSPTHPRRTPSGHVVVRAHRGGGPVPDLESFKLLIRNDGGNGRTTCAEFPEKVPPGS